MDQIIGIYNNNNNNNSDRKGLHTDICKHSRLHSSFLKKINLKGRMDNASDADIVATTDTIVTVATAGATTALGSAAATTTTTTITTANLCD